MKTLTLIFTAMLLSGATVSAKTTDLDFDSLDYGITARGYGNSFIFTEGGIEFSVFPDGQFDFYAQNYGPDVNVSFYTPNMSFSFNSGFDYGPYVQYDDFGAIIQIENVPIYYDFYGRVTQIGNVDIRYTDYGRVARVGGLYVHYNSHRVFTHYTGYINVYNRVYVYKPWHVHYVVPASMYCIVHAYPYRQYYTPVRYTYYRPYTNNYRPEVRRTVNASYNNGRRGDALSQTRLSDRYRQDANDRRNSTRGSLSSTNTQNDRNVRSVTLQTQRNQRDVANGGQNTRSVTSRTRVATGRSVNSSATVKGSERVNVLQSEKPNRSENRISNNTRSSNNTAQKRTTSTVSKQPSSRSASARSIK